MDYIRGSWCFISHPLDQPLISAFAVRTVPCPLKTCPLDCFHASLGYSFSGPAPSLWGSHPKALMARKFWRCAALGAAPSHGGWELVDSIPSFHLLLRQFWETLRPSEVLKLLSPTVATSVGFIHPFLPVLSHFMFSYTCFLELPPK